MTSRIVVFFFQAEDGIRDDLVTGVQTCALPISSLELCACLDTYPSLFAGKRYVLIELALVFDVSGSHVSNLPIPVPDTNLAIENR